MGKGIAFFILVLGLASCTQKKQAKETTPPPIRGFSVGLYTHRDLAYYDDLFTKISAFGSKSILLKVTEVQQDWKASIVHPNPYLTYPYEKMKAVLQMAARHQLRVYFMPIVLLQSVYSPGHWRGMIQPQDRERWFHTYSSMILKYAVLAQEMKVEGFLFGSELASMEGEVEFWNSLVAKIRNAYGGKIGYSSNWDHLSVSDAWRNTDFLGMTAYFELSAKGEVVSDEDLLKRWKRILPSVKKWSQTLRRPILVTEIGYPSRKDALFDPWDYTRKTEFDDRIQEQGLRVFLRAWEDFPDWMGAFIYNFEEPEDRSADQGYTPLGKRAEPLLRRWMQGP